MQVIIYTKSQCPNCVTAKQLLRERVIGFEERSIDGEETRMEFVRNYPEARQMPQIFIDNQRVGGLAGLQAALKQMGL